MVGAMSASVSETVNLTVVASIFSRALVTATPDGGWDPLARAAPRATHQSYPHPTGTRIAWNPYPHDLLRPWRPYGRRGRRPTAPRRRTDREPHRGARVGRAPRGGRDRPRAV